MSWSLEANHRFPPPSHAQFPIVGKIFSTVKKVESIHKAKKDDDENARSAKQIVDMVLPVLSRYS